MPSADSKLRGEFVVYQGKRKEEIKFIISINITLNIKLFCLYFIFMPPLTTLGVKVKFVFFM